VTTRKTTTYGPISSYKPSTTTKKPTSQTQQTNRPTTVSSTSTTTTLRSTQTYPTRPSSTPNPTANPENGGHLGVQPPSTTTSSTTPNPYNMPPNSHPPVYIIPFPFPFMPACPCYMMESSANGTSHNQMQHQQHQQQQEHQQQQNQQQYQMQQNYQYGYAIGFIPVLFVPHCAPGNYSNGFSGQQMQQVSYPCAQCNQSERGSRKVEMDEFLTTSSDSFRQVLAQAGIDIFSSPMKSPNRKSRARKLRQQREQQQQQQQQIENEQQKQNFR
jgi:hypothetical protein